MIEKYSKVFNGNGDIKACGREACKELIIACMDKYPGVNFGDPDTGMMNVENIKKVFAPA